MRWDQGRREVEDLLAGTPPALQRVTPNRDHADRLIAQARAHLASA
jgi:hypothetical protein